MDCHDIGRTSAHPDITCRLDHFLFCRHFSRVVVPCETIEQWKKVNDTISFALQCSATFSQTWELWLSSRNNNFLFDLCAWCMWNKRKWSLCFPPGGLHHSQGSQVVHCAQRTPFISCMENTEGWGWYFPMLVLNTVIKPRQLYHHDWTNLLQSMPCN